MLTTARRDVKQKLLNTWSDVATRTVLDQLVGDLR